MLFRQRINKNSTRICARLLVQVPILISGAETLEAFAILAVAIGLAGVAVLILFSRKKI